MILHNFEQYFVLFSYELAISQGPCLQGLLLGSCLVRWKQPKRRLKVLMCSFHGWTPNFRKVIHKHVPYDLNLKVKHDLEVLDSFSLFVWESLEDFRPICKICSHLTDTVVFSLDCIVTTVSTQNLRFRRPIKNGSYDG